MKRLFSLTVLLLFTCVAFAKIKDYTEFVNTLQGSYNVPEFSHGRCMPVVGTPQGMFFWSPSGFSYAEGKVGGVSGGGVHLKPLTDESQMLLGGLYDFDPDLVIAKPHYFKIRRSDGVIVEMTPTERCAVLRFTFPRSKKAILEVRQDADVYSNIRYDTQIKYSGDGYVCFGKGGTVTCYVGISRISEEQALLNLQRELGDMKFDEVVEQARKIWNEALGKIDVSGGTPEQLKTFYSCLFRTMLRPGRNYELDEEGTPHFVCEGKIYEGYYHSNPILWDAYRCLFPLHNIINTKEQEQYMLSLMRTKSLTGWWPSGHVMIGNHAISVLADAWAKGIRNFDPGLALDYYYDEITHSQLDSINNKAYNIEHVRGNGRMGCEDYFAKGYIPYPQGTNRVMETTSKTIEYNYDDFCAYKLAQMTENGFYESVFKKHIYNYRNVFDPSDGFFKGRDPQGNFDKDFNPFEWGGPFVEGNGWQWRFSVQHDAKGMMDLMSGEKRFVENLDSLFTVPGDSVLCGGYGFMIHEINEAVAGGQGQYAQGNEPCFHVIHLYNHSGQPWKAQALLRESMTKLFNSGPKGFPGDEDGGAMSAWYVFNAIGFYPVTPGVPQYVIGSPLFDKVTINLENGKKFIISASDNSPDHKYISHAVLNGVDYSKNWIAHDDIMRGGTLDFQMSSEPDYERGTSSGDRPYSLSLEHTDEVLMTGNPILEGWYADPEVAQYDNLFWIFPTTSGRQRQVKFDAFSSPDLKNWTRHENIFTADDTWWAERCMWAPATFSKDGKYYLFFSANDIQHPDSKWWNPSANTIGEVGGIGVAVADRPEGPYADLIGKPLLNEFYNMAQPIDQFVFEYEDEIYMIYGGWGRCNIARLKDDFTALVPFDDGDIVKEITPEGYVEGPVMFVRNGQLYFMWSEGDWGNDSYKVAYAMADSPFGPFKRIGTVLEADFNIASGPGHHSVLNVEGTDDWYIIYHRRPIPNYDGGHRVTCIDELKFDEDGFIMPVVMTERGAPARSPK